MIYELLTLFEGILGHIRGNVFPEFSIWTNHSAYVYGSERIALVKIINAKSNHSFMVLTEHLKLKAAQIRIRIDWKFWIRNENLANGLSIWSFLDNWTITLSTCSISIFSESRPINPTFVSVSIRFFTDHVRSYTECSMRTYKNSGMVSNTANLWLISLEFVAEKQHFQLL